MATTGSVTSGIIDMFENIKYRNWEKDDREQLVYLLEEYIREACPDFEVCIGNAEILYNCAGPVSQVAATKEGKIIAFTILAPILHIKTKVKMLHAVGTYVIPELRRKGIAETIRRIAMVRAREQGYERLQGYAHTEENTRGVTRLGGEVVGVVLETPLNGS